MMPITPRSNRSNAVSASPEKTSAAATVFGDCVVRNSVRDGGPGPINQHAVGGAPMPRHRAIGTRGDSRPAGTRGESRLGTTNAVPRPPGRPGGASPGASGTVFEISMHGQWKGLRGKGGPKCSGSFRYPLFGDAVYEGALVAGRRHGVGRQVCHSGIYIGEFKDGEMSGIGQRFYCDGGSYEGEWREGMKNGEGAFVYPNGDSFRGGFVHGIMHGRGVYVLSNGDIYRGDMHTDRMHGEGEYRFAAPHNGWYKGQFRDNARHGKGTFEFEDNGLLYRYAGTFNQDIMTGSGVLRISNGDKYEGEFLEGKFHGRGAYYWNNGSRFEGNFWQGQIHGRGLYVAAPTEHEVYGDGERFDGTWVRGVRHGPGEVELTNCVSGERETIQGVWKDGAREGDFIRIHSVFPGEPPRVVHESCVGGRRTAFSLGQHVECPGHASQAVRESSTAGAMERGVRLSPKPIPRDFQSPAKMRARPGPLLTRGPGLQREL